FNNTVVNSPFLRSSLRKAFQPLPVDSRSVIANANRSFWEYVIVEKLRQPRRRAEKSKLFFINKAFDLMRTIKLRRFSLMTKKIFRMGKLLVKRFVIFSLQRKMARNFPERLAFFPVFEHFFWQ